MIISPVLWMGFMLIVIVIWQIYLATVNASMRQLNFSLLVVVAIGIGSLFVTLGINLIGVPA